MFQQIRGVIEASHLEELNPSSADNVVMHPDPKDLERVSEEGD